MYKNKKELTLNSNKTKGNNYLKKGFTLIEFIIVMAIIGILVLMAAPKFLDYVERAKETQIKNDTKVVENILKAKMAENIANGDNKALFNTDGKISNEIMDNVNTKLDKDKFYYEKNNDIVIYKKDNNISLNKDGFYVATEQDIKNEEIKTDYDVEGEIIETIEYKSYYIGPTGKDLKVVLPKTLQTENFKLYHLLHGVELDTIDLSNINIEGVSLDSNAIVNSESKIKTFIFSENDKQYIEENIVNNNFIKNSNIIFK